MIYYCDDFSLDCDIEKLTKLATYERIKKANEYKNFENKTLSLLAFNLLQYAINNEYNLILPKEEVFSYNKNGKPFLGNEFSKIFFSISHSKKGIAVAISIKEIGVDICDFREVNQSTICKTMSKQEREEITKDKTKFYKFWSIKEANAKRKGESIFKNLTEIDYEYVSLKTDNYILSSCGIEKKIIKVNLIDLESFIENYNK